VLRRSSPKLVASIPRVLMVALMRRISQRVFRLAFVVQKSYCYSLEIWTQNILVVIVCWWIAGYSFSSDVGQG
jgi:ammonia channel protein AmtB